MAYMAGVCLESMVGSGRWIVWAWNQIQYLHYIPVYTIYLFTLNACLHYKPVYTKQVYLIKVARDPNTSVIFSYVLKLYFKLYRNLTSPHLPSPPSFLPSFLPLLSLPRLAV